MIRALTIAAVAAALAGCASFGEEFDPAAVDTLKPGVATVEDAVAALGPYNGDSRLADGTRVYTWMHSRANSLTGSAAAQSVSLIFAPDGRLKATSRSSSAK